MIAQGKRASYGQTITVGVFRWTLEAWQSGLVGQSSKTKAKRVHPGRALWGQCTSDSPPRYWKLQLIILDLRIKLFTGNLPQGYAYPLLNPKNITASDLGENNTSLQGLPGGSAEAKRNKDCSEIAEGSEKTHRHGCSCSNTPRLHMPHLKWCLIEYTI